MNGRNSRSSSSDDKHHRSKSKDRAKSEGTAKRRPRSNMSGYWSSDDLDSDISNYRNPMAMMTLGRQAVGSGPGPGGQVASRYVMQGYSTMSEHMLKSSKSNSELKHQGLPALPGPGGGGGGGGVGGSRGPMFDGNVSKGGPWSTLTLGPPDRCTRRARPHWIAPCWSPNLSSRIWAATSSRCVGGWVAWIKHGYCVLYCCGGSKPQYTSMVHLSCIRMQANYTCTLESFIFVSVLFFLLTGKNVFVLF